MARKTLTLDDLSDALLAHYNVTVVDADAWRAHLLKTLVAVIGPRLYVPDQVEKKVLARPEVDGD